MKRLNEVEISGGEYSIMIVVCNKSRWMSKLNKIYNEELLMWGS